MSALPWCGRECCHRNLGRQPPGRRGYLLGDRGSDSNLAEMGQYETLGGR
jgi:hypothetical protein